jgi:hypothetical protein
LENIAGDGIWKNAGKEEEKKSDPFENLMRNVEVE